MTDKLLTQLPSRADVLGTLTAVLTEAGLPWAWQGAAGAPERWQAGAGPSDLDVWCAGDEPLATLTTRYPCAVIAAPSDPRRLRHTSLAVLTGNGPAIIDVTHGDLRVGPILLVPAAEVTHDPVSRRLTGAAAVADLLVRPVLRGRIPEADRLAEARRAWADADAAHRSALAGRLTRQLGARVMADLIAALRGARPDPALPRRARLRLAAGSLTPGTIGATWAQRHSVWPAGRAAGPLGLRTRGVVVALVGTDGSGKSTVAGALHDQLRDSGFDTAAAYFGMARGNLPGVALARRLLGVGSTAAQTGAASRNQGAPRRAAAPGTEASRTTAGPLDHARLRRMAAWFYAGEYGWRYLRTVAPALARRQILIADRWVYDLRDSPWPGSAAARLAELVLPAPDLLVLPDAPAEMIHRRKPERGLDEQRAQQEQFRRLLAERPARCAELVVDTSGEPGAGLAELVAAVIEAAHAPRRRRRVSAGQGSKR
ncbi:thymidylate kinase [Actinoplanes sp. NPDC020271]|uniref:thymidylate kinase n=1 Tax=Actinoplanes sp. NPDC020271 TaxID=3363896 RepID=UPI0037976DE8